MQYRPSQYLPRATSQASQDEKLLRCLPLRPVLIDRWVSESRRAFKQPLTPGAIALAHRDPAQLHDATTNVAEVVPPMTAQTTMTAAAAVAASTRATQTRYPFTVYHTPKTHNTVPQRAENRVQQPQQHSHSHDGELQRRRDPGGGRRQKNLQPTLSTKPRVSHDVHCHPSPHATQAQPTTVRCSAAESAVQTDEDPLHSALRSGLIMARIHGPNCNGSDGAGDRMLDFCGNPQQSSQRQPLLLSTGLLLCPKCRVVITAGVGALNCPGGCRSELVPLVGLLRSPTDAKSLLTMVVPSKYAAPVAQCVAGPHGEKAEGRPATAVRTKKMEHSRVHVTTAECLHWCD